MVVVPTFGGKPQEDDVRVVIKDLDPNPKFHLGLPGSHTVAQLYSSVAQKRGYRPRSFELVVVEDSVLLATEHDDMTLSSLIRDRGTTKLQLALARAPEYQGSQHDDLFEGAGMDVNGGAGEAAASSMEWKSNAVIGGLHVADGYGGDASRSNFRHTHTHTHIHTHIIFI